MSFRVTIACSRAQGEAIAASDDLLPDVVLVADEPDASKPDDWLIHAYFEHSPTKDELQTLRTLGSGEPRIEELGESDWVTMSQSGLQPIRAGRFYVHTPTVRSVPPGTIPFEIDASLAFGTGQHATTSGCLEALDRLEREGKRFANIADIGTGTGLLAFGTGQHATTSGCLEALDRLERGGAHFANVADIGTGTGLLAFAALALWPDAKCIATDIDPIAVDVARDNAAINRVKLGHGSGELLLAVADGMDSPLLAARAPFDLIVANILAGPLIELAPAFSKALGPRGVIILAGLLDTQADALATAYEQHGLPIRDRGFGEWPVLVCERTG